MDYETNQKYLNNENQESCANSFYNDCFINSNPVSNYMNEFKTKLKKYKYNKICNLDDPKLIDAYNEGYYGFNNVPKQYYIYPKFSKKEYFKNQKYLKEPKNYYRICELINKENNINYINDEKNAIDNKFQNNNDTNDNFYNINYDKFVYSYTNYPYPKLINISSNVFGTSHRIKSNYEILNNKLINNNQIEDDENIQEISEVENLNDNNDKDNANFYFINNTVTTRNVPFQNIPDDISIDDEEQEEKEL
jgi:hypothetical protein